ncbi:MAG: efflux RND transporter periplasmic adaptor subunit [Victivallaceae bacterium]|nr:efflux RND transporter periplasmic adaptor subunit [Victivallaceae bacterium]
MNIKYLQGMLLCFLLASVASAQDNLLASVRVEKVSSISQTEPRTYVGTVMASEEVDIVARISGVMWKFTFKEGDLVKKGDLLFQIEDTIYQENVNIARATLQQCEAELQYANQECVRHGTLYKSNATAKSTYENSLRAQQVCQGKVNAARANLALAENSFSYTKIRSPLSGMIGRNVYSQGNYITPEKGTLTTIVQYDPINIKFSISEVDFLRYMHGKKEFPEGSIEIFCADGKLFPGKVKLDFMDNQVDSKTGTLTIQLEAANPDMVLIPGGYVMVNCIDKFEKPQLSVSVSALMTDGKNNYVFIVDKDHCIQRRVITKGPLVRDRQIVLSGLKLDETVVVGGINKVQPGVRVTPVFSEKTGKEQ